MRSVISTVALAAATLALAACGAQPLNPEAEQPHGERAAQTQSDPTARTARRPPPPPIDEDPQKLIGLAPAALEGMLGEPRFVRRDDPAQLWRYAGRSCVLDLFLYVGEGGGYRVRHFEARSAGDEKISDRACFNALLTERRDARRS